MLLVDAIKKLFSDKPWRRLMGWRRNSAKNSPIDLTQEQLKSLPPPPIITDNKGLAELCNQIKNQLKNQQQAAIAIDTEFMRERTYYPNLALIQLATESQSWIIDPLVIDQWQPFSAILTDPTITKVFHSPAEDLEVLNHHLKCLPHPLFDTQTAVQVFEWSEKLGYANLVEMKFGITLDKSETRSNWLQRPLTPMQLSYAIRDVLWLLPLHKMFIDLGRTETELWQECIDQCEQLLVRAKQPKIHPKMYRKIRASKSLSNHQNKLLQKMCEWREEIAERKNIPKTWVIRDINLVKLCKMVDKRTISLSVLYSISGYPKPSIKQHGKQVIDQLVLFNTELHASKPQ